MLLLCAAGAVDTKQFDADADRMFDWEDVIMVDMRSATPVQCPISLDSPPVCPQITPCGHVFSFGSIMRHLMTHGGEHLRRSAPCPLCYQALVARELRLVQVSKGSGAHNASLAGHSRGSGFYVGCEEHLQLCQLSYPTSLYKGVAVPGMACLKKACTALISRACTACGGRGVGP